MQDSFVPYYVQVAETIKNRILSGYYREGEPIPSYRKLEKEFKISNATVRKAIDLLVQEGWISKRRGLGTNVKTTRIDKIVWELSGNLQRLRDSSRHIELKTEVLQIENIPCPEVIGKILALDTSGEIWRMRKIRKLGDTVMSYYISYTDLNTGQKIDKESAEKMKFADLLREKCGIKLAKLEQKLEASTAELDLAKILKVSFGFPILYVENVYYADNERPVALTQIYYPGDRNVYRATIALWR